MPDVVGELVLLSLSAATAETTIGAGGWVTTTTLASAGYGSVLGVSAASIVGSGALFAGSVALAYATAPSVPKPSDGTSPLRQATPPRIFGYGRARIAGSYMLFEIDPASSPAISWDVLALHHGAISAFVFYYLNEDMVTLNGSGVVAGALNWNLADGRYGANVPANAYVTIKTTLGPAANTAFANVISAMPQFWTSAHRGDGIAGLMMRTLTNSNVSGFPTWYPRGLPKPSVVADLAPIWDHRDGTQVRATPSTWLVSSNPVVQLIDYLTQGYGPGISYTDAISPVQSAWDTEASYCDASQTLADGVSTEPLYASNGWALMTTDPADVIAAILATCDGWLSEKGDGTLALFVGKYRSPSVTFTDDHIVAYTLDKGVPDEEVVNQINFTYTPPNNNFKEAPGNPWQNSASISLLGKIRAQSMQLHWVQSHTQARRLAKRAMSRHQAVARGTLTTTLYGLKGLGERWINVTSTTIADLASAVIEVMPHPRVDLAAGRVTFNFVVIDPSAIDAWTPATEEGSKPNFYPVPGTVNGSTITVADNGGGTHKIKVTFADPKQNWLAYAVEYRIGAGAWTRQTFAAPQTPVGSNIVLVTNAITPGTYSVRVATIGPQSTEVGNWTSVAGTSVVIA